MTKYAETALLVCGIALWWGAQCVIAGESDRSDWGSLVVFAIFLALGIVFSWALVIEIAKLFGG